jgi:hypothetical protein
MELGSVWGHGSYVAPDWTADWLHREALFILNAWASPAEYSSLPPERRAELESRLQQLLRRNTYDAGAATVTVDPIRAQAFEANVAYYTDVFTNGREAFAIPAGTLVNREHLRALAAFFFWTSWAASTNRPNDTVTYTSNWPHEPLVGNRPTGDAIVWTGVSIILLLAGIGVMASYYASARDHAPLPPPPANDPLLGSVPTPSQRAVVKYFWVGVRADSGADSAGCRCRALRRRGRRVLRHSHLHVPAVFNRSHLARPARDPLDRHRMARGRPVHRPGGQRGRTKISASRRQRPVRGVAHRRGGIDGGPVAQCEADARHREPVVLPRSQRLRSTSTSGGCGRSRCSRGSFSGSR